MSIENKTQVTLLGAIDMIARSTKQYVDSVNFSGSYNDLTDVPDTVVTKNDVAQATNEEVINSLLNIFK